MYPQSNFELFNSSKGASSLKTSLSEATDLQHLIVRSQNQYNTKMPNWIPADPPQDSMSDLEAWYDKSKAFLETLNAKNEDDSSSKSGSAETPSNKEEVKKEESPEKEQQTTKKSYNHTVYGNSAYESFYHNLKKEKKSQVDEIRALYPEYKDADPRILAKIKLTNVHQTFRYASNPTLWYQDYVKAFNNLKAKHGEYLTGTRVHKKYKIKLSQDLLWNSLTQDALESNEGGGNQALGNYGNLTALPGSRFWTGDLLLGNDRQSDGTINHPYFKVFKSNKDYVKLLEDYLEDKFSYMATKFSINGEESLKYYLDKCKNYAADTEYVPKLNAVRNTQASSAIIMNILNGKA